jgi:hypothetical protein
MAYLARETAKNSDDHHERIPLPLSQWATPQYGFSAIELIPGRLLDIVDLFL